MLASPAALAQPRDRPPEERRVPPSDVVLRSGAGESWGHDGALALQAMVLFRRGTLDVGATGAAGFALFGYSYGSVGAAAGAGWRAPAGFRLDALALGGVDRYQPSDNGWLNEDVPTGSVPYAGVGLVASKAFFFRTPGHLEIGADARLTDDLERRATPNGVLGEARATVAVFLGFEYDMR